MAARPVRLITLAAPDRHALVEAARRLRALPLEALDRALRAPEPAAGPARLGIVAPLDEIAAALDHLIERLPAWTRPRLVSRAHGLHFTDQPSPGRVAFLFPGQGSEYVGMLGALRARLPAVSAWFDALDEAAGALGQPPATALIDPPDDEDARAEARRSLYDMERGAQLGSVADLAMHEVATDLGFRADVHLGHSNGEHPAVIAAGRVELPRAALCRGFVELGLAGARMPRPPVPERLVAVSAIARPRLDDVLSAAQGRVALAMDNCPSQAVVGGAADDVEEAASAVTALGGIVAPLPFARAYHTPRFADWAGTFAAYYDTLPLGPGRVPVWSCWSVAPLPEAAGACREAMAAQWTALVRLREAIARLHDEGVTLFVEVGPDSKLTAFVDDTLRGRHYAAVATNHAGRDDFAQIAHAVAQAFVAGFDVDAAAADRLVAPPQPAPALVTTTATTATTLTRAVRDAAAGVHRRLIADAEARLARAAAIVAPSEMPVPAAVPGPLAGAPVARTTAHARGRRRFSREGDPFVDDHALGRRRAAHPGGYPLPVLPFTASVAIALEATRWWRATPAAELRDVTATRWLALDDGALDVDVDTRRRGADVEVRLRDAHATAPGDAFTAAATWRAGAEPDVPVDPDARPPRRWSARDFYDRFAFHGPSFQGITSVETVGPHSIEATLTVTALPGLETASLVADPALVDCAGQLVAFWRLERGAAPDFGLFPFRARRILVAGPPCPPGMTLRARASIVERDGTTESTVRIETPDGALVAALAGFGQRIVPLTPAVAALIVAGDATAVPGPEDEALLDSSWFIWERAIAHLRLGPDDLARWRGLDAVSGARRQWLLARLRGEAATGLVPE